MAQTALRLELDVALFQARRPRAVPAIAKSGHAVRRKGPKHRSCLHERMAGEVFKRQSSIFCAQRKTPLPVGKGALLLVKQGYQRTRGPPNGSGGGGRREPRGNCA